MKKEQVIGSCKERRMVADSVTFRLMQLQLPLAARQYLYDMFIDLAATLDKG